MYSLIYHKSIEIMAGDNGDDDDDVVDDFVILSTQQLARIKKSVKLCM